MRDKQTHLVNAIYDLEQRITYNATLNDSTAAQYRPGTQTILLYTLKENNLSNIEGDFYHELGHKVWFVYLTEEQQTKYTALYNKTTNFVSDYAKTDVKEDFAENYKAYRLNQSIKTSRLNFFKEMEMKYER
jgi:hypothetical protein